MRGRKTDLGIISVLVLLSFACMVWGVDSLDGNDTLPRGFLDSSLINSTAEHRPSPFCNLGESIVLDADGNLYATLPGSSGYGVEKYGSNGLLCWRRECRRLPTGGDLAKAVAVDKDGNVYVTGQYRERGGDFDYLTTKYDSGGDQKWARLFDDSEEDDLARDIIVDGDGNVYVTGMSFESIGDSDFLTVKYNGDGREIWVQRYDGPSHGPDRADAISLNTDGSVSVTGFSPGYDSAEEYATVKYDPDGNQVQVIRFASENKPENLSS